MNISDYKFKDEKLSNVEITEIINLENTDNMCVVYFKHPSGLYDNKTVFKDDLIDLNSNPCKDIPIFGISGIFDFQNTKFENHLFDFSIHRQHFGGLNRSLHLTLDKCTFEMACLTEKEQLDFFHYLSTFNGFTINECIFHGFKLDIGELYHLPGVIANPTAGWSVSHCTFKK